MTYALAFALTVAVEGCVAAAILRRFFWVETAAIQLVTGPLVALIVPLVRHLVLVEAGVGIVETGLWMLVLPIGWRRAAVVSIVANSASAAIGLLFQ